MSGGMLFELGLIAALIVLNGVLAMSEMAVVSSRTGRLKAQAARSRGAAMALRLAENPGRFLSTVQIGITMVGVLSGAVSGATLGLRLQGWLAAQGLPADLAATLGVGGVVVAITYASLIVGELVPKQIALRNPEGVAARVAPMMTLLAFVVTPVVLFLDISGRAVLWLLGVRGAADSRVTEEEVHVLLTEASEGGVIEAEEHVMMAGVMRLGDRSARALMTPRHDVDMLDAAAKGAEAVAAIRRIARPRMPVMDSAGDVLGIVRLTEAFDAVSRRQVLEISALLREVPVVSDRADALDVLSVLYAAPDHMALVYDEYGHFEGIITTSDILEAITGAEAAQSEGEPALVEREDGSLLVAGWMPADELCDRLGWPREVSGDYDTVAGLVLHQFGRIPELGEVVRLQDHVIEVVDLDGRRIDKLLIRAA
jgi:putative hemolysin